MKPMLTLIQCILSPFRLAQQVALLKLEVSRLEQANLVLQTKPEAQLRRLQAERDGRKAAHPAHVCTQDILQESVQEFIKQKCIHGPGFQCSLTDLHRAYCAHVGLGKTPSILPFSQAVRSLSETMHFDYHHGEGGYTILHLVPRPYGSEVSAEGPDEQDELLGEWLSRVEGLDQTKAKTPAKDPQYFFKIHSWLCDATLWNPKYHCSLEDLWEAYKEAHGEKAEEFRFFRYAVENFDYSHSGQRHTPTIKRGLPPNGGLLSVVGLWLRPKSRVLPPGYDLAWDQVQDPDQDPFQVMPEPKLSQGLKFFPGATGPRPAHDEPRATGSASAPSSHDDEDARFELWSGHVPLRPSSSLIQPSTEGESSSSVLQPFAEGEALPPSSEK